jgi:hypothetical protein
MVSLLKDTPLSWLVMFLEPEVAIDVVVDGGDQLAELLSGGLAGKVQRAIPGLEVDHFLYSTATGSVALTAVAQNLAAPRSTD